MSSNIDDRTLHELYMWPFADSIRANVAAIMCSYNKVNSTYACESDAVMNGLVKDELNFPGYLLSDWEAQHTTAGSANAGLDMSMPGNTLKQPNSFLWGRNLSEAVPQEVFKSRLDDMVRRVLASWYYLNQDEGYPNTTIFTLAPNNPDVQKDHKEVARAIARDGIVLLKNEKGALPLKAPKSKAPKILAVIGSDSIVDPGGPNRCLSRTCNNGTLAMGWGSGAVEFPYLVGPLDAIRERAEQDGTVIRDSTTDSPSEGASVASVADTAVVFINANSGEGSFTVEGVAGDRPNLDPWHGGNELVKAVAEVNANTIVVIHSVGPLILENILSQSNVKAVVWAGLPGQESGNALVDVLYGSTSPSGKLPYTIALKESDYSSTVAPKDDDYSEGLFIDYRHFDKEDTTPRFEFGFGLC
jgi:beta-glucosidase